MSAWFEQATEDELIAWEQQHDSLIKWSGMWRKLVWVFFGIVVWLIFFTDYTALALAFMFTQWAFVIAQVVCDRRHYKLHEARGDFEEL